MWIYVQRTGFLYRHTTEPENYVDRGYAGQGAGWNNPNFECIQDIGPIPVGGYMIGPIDNAGPSPESLFLTPDLMNQMCGRSRFWMHGDSITNPGNASKGCIIMKLATRRAIAQSRDTVLRVISETG